MRLVSSRCVETPCGGARKCRHLKATKKTMQEWRRVERRVRVDSDSVVESGARGQGLAADQGFDRRSLLRLQVDQFPDVTVRILEAVPVHESLILRLSRSTSSRSDRLLHELVDSRATLTGKTHDDF